MTADQRPIVVLGAPRSGTSLTAGLFAQHGVWTGNCMAPDSRNALGYFENLDLKRSLIEHCGRLVNRGELADRLPEGVWSGCVQKALDAGGYTGGPWLFKHSAMYYPAWLTDFDPIFVCCFRNPRDIAASGKASRLLTESKAIAAHHRVMGELLDYGAHKVSPERFIRHEWDQLLPPFHEAGLEFDEDVARAFVRPDLWHDWSQRESA